MCAIGREMVGFARHSKNEQRMSGLIETQAGEARLRILVVEDNDMLRTMFLKAFPSMHKVYAASGTKEGWKLFLETVPHVVFLDIGLPDGNGNDLAREMKECNPATYIVMSTANNEMDNKKEAVRNRVDGFIVKPFSKAALSECVDQFMNIQRRNGQKR